MAEVPNIDCKDFKLGKVLGHGGYGRVYEGKWKDRRVAVKEIREGDKSFDIEVEQLSRVKDSNIIELFATAANEEFKYIIMEYADGGSLHNFLHSEFKPFYTESQGLNWACQCARGVSYLHKMRKPMLHRDLKPQNMLLTKNYSLLKICDFGTVAELKSSMTSERGTNMYMAPEVFGGRKYNEKCDVYSWAILLWEILSREEPFKDVEAKNVVPFLASKGKRPADTISCPPAIKRLMESCWDKNPDKRPTMETIVAVVSLHVTIFHSPSENDVRKHFPTIPSDNCYHFENLKRIRWNSNTIVHMGKMAHKKVTIMTFPLPYGSKAYIWLQQHLPLKHKNIISILGIKGSVPKAAVLDYTDLIPLDLFLHGDDQLEYSRAHALSWAHQCSEGMKYLKSIKPKPFIRLALNPTNLLLTQGATQLKIGNFEIFEWTNLSFRNIAYEAPEVCEKNIAIKESDVYSWAIVLWEMLTRQKPFGNIPVHQVSSHIIDGERPAIVEDWPETIKKLMENCWDRNWRERPTMENVASEMATFVGAPLNAIVSANDLQSIHQLMPWDANVEEFNKLSPTNPRVPDLHSCNDTLCQAMDICIDRHLFYGE